MNAHDFKNLLIVSVCIVVGVTVIYYLCVLFVAIANQRKLLKRSMVILEVTPPVSVDKSSAATEQLFSVVHGLISTRRLKDRILNRSASLSFEIISSKQHGIRYLIRVESKLAHTIKQAIISYLPDVKIKTATDNFLESNNEVIEFKQTGHFVFPLKESLPHELNDPMAYITGSMTKTNADEQLSYQIVLKPIKLREANDLSHRILGNEDILSHMHKSKIPVIQTLLNLVTKTMFAVTDTAGEIYHGPTKGSQRSASKDAQFQMQVSTRQRPARTLSAFELELMESMHRKVRQPLFQASIRVMVHSDDMQSTHERISSLKSALDAYSTAPYQQIKVKMQIPAITRYRLYLYKNRLQPLRRRSSMILSVSEVASLFHFQDSRHSRADNLVSSLSRTLPAPISLKGGNKLDVLIGENNHQGINTPIGLTEAERERHVYIIGGTGNGKTTMIIYQIIQDIRNGKGIAVVDPHGDLAEKILEYIPQDRINDVIYMNPDDLQYPMGMNLLELTPGLSGNDLLREKDIVTEATVSVLRKIFSEDDTGGHRIEYILRNAIQTSLTLEDPTLFTIFKLLNDAKFRRKVTSNLEDENLRDFWKNELGKAGEFQRVKMAAGITAKIGRFLFSASARAVLEQPKSTINFEDILASRKILICNFSKGLLGDDTSTLFGTTVLAKLQTASLRRARLKVHDRVPFYLYVDEFQNFATMSFVQMLSEARKYKLFLIMAEQSTSQQDQQRLVDIILANAGTVVVFRSGSPTDERLVLPLFSPYIEQGEIANLPSYNFYARIAAVHSQEPMSGLTVLLDNGGSEAVAKRVIESSRKLYAKQPTSVPIKKVYTKQKVSGIKASSKKKTNQATKKNYDGLKNDPNVA